MAEDKTIRAPQTPKAPKAPRARPAAPAPAAAAEGEAVSVLQAFGLELKVSNPRLAELLTMDAKEALTTDLGDLAGRESKDTAAVAAAVPLVAAPAPAAEDAARTAHRRELAEHVAGDGASLGFEVGQGGVWRSHAGISLLVRAIDGDVTLMTASRFAGELASAREGLAGPDSSVLFVTDGQQAADVFSVAIRREGLHDRVRTVSLANLDRLSELHRAGTIGSAQVLMLLAPIADIDPGEIVSVLTAAQGQVPG